MWRLTPWWQALFDGLLGAVLSGVVAAGTAWLVVNLTSKRQRRDTLVSETRQAVRRLYMLGEEIRDLLVDDPLGDSLELKRRLRVSLADARALVAALNLAEDDTELRRQVYSFLAGVRARESGEPPAVINKPYAELRGFLKDLIVRLDRAAPRRPERV